MVQADLVVGGASVACVFLGGGPAIWDGVGLCWGGTGALCTCRICTNNGWQIEEQKSGQEYSSSQCRSVVK